MSENVGSPVEQSAGSFFGAMLGGIYIGDMMRQMPDAVAKLCLQAYEAGWSLVNHVSSQSLEAWDLLNRCGIDSRSIPTGGDIIGGLAFAAIAAIEPWVSGEPKRRLTKLDTVINGFQGACAMGTIFLARMLWARAEVTSNPVMWENIDQPMWWLGTVANVGMLTLGTLPAIKLLAMGGQGVLRRVRGEAKIVEVRTEQVEEIREEPAIPPIPNRPVFIPIETLVSQGQAQRRREKKRVDELARMYPGSNGLDQMVKEIMIKTREEFDLLRRILGIKEHG